MACRVTDATRNRSAAWTVAWCAVAFGSGAAALLFETLWFRVAGLALGHGVWASSVVLAAFMAGLALGNAWAARRADAATHPARLYAALEVTIGVCGLALVAGLPAAIPLLATPLGALRDTPWLMNGLRLLLAFGTMMIPASAMGATLPVLVKSLSLHDARFAAVLGRLYGWNTLGAVVGALLGESLLLAALGMRGTALAALVLNLSSAAGALALGRAAAARPWKRAPAAVPGPITRPGRLLLLAAFFSGATFLALEVVWFRLLALFVYGTSVVFAVLLAVVLAGIGLGGLTAARWLRGGRRAAPALPALALASACATLVTYAAFPRVVDALLPPGQAAAALWHVALLAVPLMLPVAWLSGVLFTALGEAARESLGGEARTAGLLTLANTIGGALGSLAGGFVLLPHVGLEGSLQLLAGVYAGIALLTVPSLASRERRGPLLGALAAGLAALFLLFPTGQLRSKFLVHPTLAFQEPGSRIVAVREGILQTLVLMRTERFGRTLHLRLFTDGFSMSGTTAHSRRYMKAYVYLPVALHPALKDALLISYGVGSTAKALTDTDSIERIDVVDISPEILETSALVYPRRSDDPLEDPRVHVHVEDGRFFLQTTERRFDLVTSEPPPPKYAGVVNLYSREYFELIRARLNEGGISTYWLPVHNLSEADARAILRAWCDVFDDCTLWTGAGLDWMMMGTRSLEVPVSEAFFRRQWDDPVVGPELRGVGFEDPAQMGATFLAGTKKLRRWTEHTPPVADDFPLRISSRPVQPSDSQRSSFFREAMETGETAREFERSAFVHRVFPAAMREATLAFFRWQRLLNARLVYDGSESVEDADLHALLTESELETLPLWLLGSGAVEQRIVAGISQASSDPDVNRIRAVGALAARDWPGAVGWLERARASRPGDARLLDLEVYALCLDDRRDDAFALARRLLAVSPEAEGADAHWRWLGETFGLPDPREDGPRRDARWSRP